MMVHEFCKKEGNSVKYIFQFARITAFCLAGEVLAAVLPLPIPASVYGLLLLAAGRGMAVWIIASGIDAICEKTDNEEFLRRLRYIKE